MLWYSIEVPCSGTSNEYQQHNFSWRNKKNINIAIITRSIGTERPLQMV